MKRVLTAALFASMASGALATDQSVTYKFDGSFEDAAFGVESAILDRGLVIDYVSHTGEMLNRTGADVGSGTEIFSEADIFLFCSAVLSRKVMEINPMNIAHCPYGIFVAQRGEAVMIGYRTYPEGEMQDVQALLDSIAREAVGE